MKKLLYQLGLWKPNMYSIKQVQNESLLLAIALQDSEVLHRRSAIRHLKHETSILEVLKNESNTENKCVAVARIKNKHTLEELAQSGKEPKVRLTAIRTLSNPELSMNLYWEEKHEEVKKGIIEDTDDKKFLEEVINSNPKDELIKTILDKGNDQALLSKIIHSENSIELRKTALEKLMDSNPYSDKKFLEEIINSNPKDELIETILEKENDQVLISKIILSGNKIDLRKSALEKLTDSERLKEISKTSPDGAIREAATSKIQEQILAENKTFASEMNDILFEIEDEDSFHKKLREFVHEGKGYGLNVRHLKRIEDEELLLSVIKLNKDNFAPFSPVEKSEVLQKLGKKSQLELAKWDNSILFLLTSQTSDKDVLQEVFLHIEDENFDPAFIWGMCRNMREINKDQTFKNIIAHGKSKVVKLNAFAQIEDNASAFILDQSIVESELATYASIIRDIEEHETLNKIIAEAKDPQIKEAAHWKKKVLENNSFEELVNYLREVGEEEGFLNSMNLSELHKYEFKGHVKARTIGRILKNRGGKSQMMKVYNELANYSSVNIRHLEFAWDGIGSWAG